MTDRSSTLLNVLERVDGMGPRPDNPLPKHQKMAANPFRFLRGTAALFYQDLQDRVLKLPDLLEQHIPLTCVMGDCHVSNFGFFTEEGSHGDNVVFAPNDFDDACIGHSAWDLCRFSVSLLLCADYCQGIATGAYISEEIKDVSGLRGATEKQAINAIHCFLQSYVKQCAALAEGSAERSMTLNKFKKSHVLHSAWRKAEKRAAGGKQFMSKSALAKAVCLPPEKIRFRADPTKYKPLPKRTYTAIEEAFGPYVDDSILNIVERLGAGTGSVNMPRYYLLVGPTGANEERYFKLCHIVEVKQQREAAPLYFFRKLHATNRLNPAHLTVVCQRRMQHRPDLVLDDRLWRRRHYLIRSRHHAKVGINPEDIGLSTDKKSKSLEDYAATCGTALALAHSRGDRRSTRFEQAVVTYLPAATDALIEASMGYREQVISDHQWLQKLLKNGHP